MSSTRVQKSKAHQWQIVGCMFSVHRPAKGIVIKSIVGPEFIELWYKIVDDDFDKNLWEELSRKEQRLMMRSYNLCRIENPAFNKQIATEYKAVAERVDSIEGEVLAGNVNEDLVNEYNNIVDEMAKMRLIITTQAQALKRKMKMIYDQSVKAVDKDST